MRAISLVFALLPQIAAADSWQPLRTDAEIIRALADRTLVYDAYTFQRFGALGDTQYITDRLSDGRWEARDGQYCSAWPPSDIWTCYTLEVAEDQVRFIGETGSVSTGTYRN